MVSLAVGPIADSHICILPSPPDETSWILDV
jgi:hypothetical protein